MAIAVIDYRDNDLGDYHEVGITFFVTPATTEAGNGGDDAGTYRIHLPVDQAFTCEAGRTIWGFPKTVEDIAVGYSPTAVTCTLRTDGQLVLRLPCPGAAPTRCPRCRSPPTR